MIEDEKTERWITKPKKNKELNEKTKNFRIGLFFGTVRHTYALLVGLRNAYGWLFIIFNALCFQKREGGKHEGDGERESGRKKEMRSLK